jgi:hypothetical protein
LLVFSWIRHADTIDQKWHINQWFLMVLNTI